MQNYQNDLRRSTMNAIPFHEINRHSSLLRAAAAGFIKVLRTTITDTARLNSVVEKLLRELHTATPFPAVAEDKSAAVLDSLWVNSDLVDHPKDAQRTVVLGWASNDRKFKSNITGAHYIGHDEGSDYYARTLHNDASQLSVFMANEHGIYGELIARNIREDHPWYWIIVRAQAMQIIPVR